MVALQALILPSASASALLGERSWWPVRPGAEGRRVPGDRAVGGDQRLTSTG
ncbi:hypothetical protein AB0D12_32470 [Streptomyces sp. NPDC048479]|uniref:hypothetical protein n=1 Tax=Streptomyces sp. NPDC048479 TaxID=3154725 RepID=UPI003435E83E